MRKYITIILLTIATIVFTTIVSPPNIDGDNKYICIVCKQGYLIRVELPIDGELLNTVIRETGCEPLTWTDNCLEQSIKVRVDKVIEEQNQSGT